MGINFACLIYKTLGRLGYRVWLGHKHYWAIQIGFYGSFVAMILYVIIVGGFE